MQDQSLRISFADAGPGQAGEHAASLANWLNDTVVREAGASEGAAPVTTELVPGNPNAQLSPDTVKVIWEAASHGVMAGAVAGVAHFTFDQTVKPTTKLLAKHIAQWWKNNGKPALRLAFFGQVRNIPADSQNPEEEIAGAMSPPREP